MINVAVFTEQIKLPFKSITRKQVMDIAERSSSLAGHDNAAITIILTDNSYIHDINKQYRQKDMPTDVIAFANRDMEFPEIGLEMEDLGDIFISLEKAYEQSTAYGVSLSHELTRLIIHGILHCSGYDHEKSREEALLMEQKEEEILKQLTTSPL